MTSKSSLDIKSKPAPSELIPGFGQRSEFVLPKIWGFEDFERPCSNSYFFLQGRRPSAARVCITVYNLG
ncbi:unnamed protein product [Arctogadus glacialis]